VYFGLKLLHVAAVTVWFAGLCFLPALLRMRERRPVAPVRAAWLGPAANLVFFRVATPAALAAIALGMVLVAQVPFQGWLAAKLGLVALAVLLHVHLGLRLYRSGAAASRPRLAVAYGAAVLLLLAGIAALTAAKPRTFGDLPAPPRHAAVHGGTSLPASSSSGPGWPWTPIP